MTTTAIKPPPPIKHHGRGTSVEVRDLTVRAGGKTLLEQAFARFTPGTVTLIVGPSGVGKSLLLRILAGLIGRGHDEIHVNGSVKFDGEDILRRRPRHPAGVVFQNFALFDEFSPAENVRFAVAHRKRRKSLGDGDAGHNDASLEAADLLEELRVPVSTRTASLSGGQRQRLAIARTLAFDPDVILYDEPTSGLDIATAEQVARLIKNTHSTHPKTSIIVTHDYEALAPIADTIYLLDPATQSLRQLDREEWPHIGELLQPPPADEPPPPGGFLGRLGPALAKCGSKFFSGTTRVAEETLLAPLRLLPLWKSPAWGARYLLYYLRLVAGPSAWAYLAVSGLIVGFVVTYFTLVYFPYARFTKPVLIDDVLKVLGFALFRIFVPVLATILVAARCAAAVASDVGGKGYGNQMDAMRSFGARPNQYLLTPILYAFLIGTPLLVLLSYGVASLTSLTVFTAMEPERGPPYWMQNFHRELSEPGQYLFQGTDWLLAKTLVCAAGIALIAYHRGARPKYSSRDVSTGITTTILWTTLYVLVVHFAFAFVEFQRGVSLWNWLGLE